MAELKGKWYLGAMNDGLFIIDQPPQPAPTDYFCDVDHGVNVIAAMGNDRVRAEQIVAAHNETAEELERLHRTMQFWEQSYLAEHETWGHCQWKAEHEELKANLDALLRENDRLLDLVNDLADPSECRLDHHGYCQTHAWFEVAECPHGKARQFIFAEAVTRPSSTTEGK